MADPISLNENLTVALNIQKSGTYFYDCCLGLIKLTYSWDPMGRKLKSSARNGPRYPLQELQHSRDVVWHCVYLLRQEFTNEK